MIRRAAPVLCAAAVAVVAASPAVWAQSVDSAERYCTPTDPGLSELSGMTVLDNTVYGMGDSGADDRVARLDVDCAVAQWLPNPVDPYDVEDLSSYDGFLWLADIGDNDRRRDSVALVRMDPARGGAGELHRLTYPDGAHDAEALLIGSDGRPVIVTKDGLGTGGVYSIDTAVDNLPSPGPTPLRRVTDFAPTATTTPGGPPLLDGSRLVTGGAVSVDGTVAAVRTYTDLYLWPVNDGDVAEAMASPPSTVIALPPQPQGESIAFTDDGDLLVGSEQGLDSSAALPPVQVLRDAVDRVSETPPAQAQSAEPDPDAPAEPTGSILIPLLAAAASVGVVVVVTAFFLRRLFRSR
ncbi:MAG: hypothetical protein WBF79_12000 [Rhodococcus sp. (in: high G+C Gram-positive bacteria)]